MARQRWNVVPAPWARRIDAGDPGGGAAGEKRRNPGTLTLDASVQQSQKLLRAGRRQPVERSMSHASARAAELMAHVALRAAARAGQSLVSVIAYGIWTGPVARSSLQLRGFAIA